MPQKGLGVLEWLCLGVDHFSENSGLPFFDCQVCGHLAEVLKKGHGNALQMEEIRSIGSLPCLEHVALLNNPLSIIPDYRTKVLAQFGERASEVSCLGRGQLEVPSAYVYLPDSEGHPDPEGPFRSGQSAASPGKVSLMHLLLGATGCRASSVGFPSPLSELQVGVLPRNQQAQPECGGTVFNLL